MWPEIAQQACLAINISSGSTNLHVAAGISLIVYRILFFFFKFSVTFSYFMVPPLLYSQDPQTVPELWESGYMANKFSQMSNTLRGFSLIHVSYHSRTKSEPQATITTGQSTTFPQTHWSGTRGIHLSLMACNSAILSSSHHDVLIFSSMQWNLLQQIRRKIPRWYRPYPLTPSQTFLHNFHIVILNRFGPHNCMSIYIHCE